MYVTYGFYKKFLALAKAEGLKITHIRETCECRNEYKSYNFEQGKDGKIRFFSYRFSNK